MTQNSALIDTIRQRLTTAERSLALLLPEDPLDRLPDGDLLASLADHVARSPERTMLDFLRERPDGSRARELYSYGDFWAIAHVLAEDLRAAGVRRGDMVAVLMRNSPEWLATFVATLQLGAVLVPINYDFTPEEAGYYLDRTGAQVLVTSPQLLDLAHVLADRHQALREVLVPAAGALRGRTPDGGVAAALEPADLDAVALVMFTSGTTTARPKGVMLTRRHLYLAASEYERVFGVGPDDRVMVVTPLFHVNALQFGCGIAMLRGATIVMTQRFSASRFWGEAELTRPTVLWTMGGILSILLSRPQDAQEVRGRATLRAVGGGGIGALHDRIRERFAERVMDCYGLTETAGGTYTPLDGSHVVDQAAPSVGRPLRHIEIGVMRPDGELAEVGEPGEIVFRVRPGWLMLGYIGEPELTAEALSDGWFHSGDQGLVGADGCLHFLDREKDIVRRAGENISSLEVEAVLREHPDIADCAVVPEPDVILGEVVRAYVVPSGTSIDIAGVEDLCNRRLARHKRPARLVVRTALPRTPTGKVKKYLLRAEAAREAQAGHQPICTRRDSALADRTATSSTAPLNSG